MTDLTSPDLAGRISPGTRSQIWRVSDQPVLVFWLLSLLIGGLLIIVTPPLRGPDEGQHFLRAYGVAQGDFLPATLDGRGRKGLYLPAGLKADFAFFDALPSKQPGVSFRDVQIDYARLKPERSSTLDRAEPVFVPYAGAEGYSPLGYLPYAAAVLVAQLLKLDFIGMLYLMRVFGLIAFTSLVAYALMLAPVLRWAILAAALLPAAAYARAVITADAAALGSTMVVTAMCLRAAFGDNGNWRQRIVWFALCALTKPPNLAFILLEPMSRGARTAITHWRTTVAITLPALVLAIVWSILSAAEVAAWRLTDLTGVPTEQFGPMWKLGYLIEHPLHFPTALLGTMTNAGELWRQLVGVLGLFDTELLHWVYPTLTGLFLACCLSPLPLPRATRLWIAGVATAAVLAYVFTVFLIFYLVWTPPDAEQIWGVQGRYFLPALPALAIAIAAIAGRGLLERNIAMIATCAALISGGAAIEGILRFDWEVL